MSANEEEKQPDLDLKALGGFIGTQCYYNVLGTRVTEGVKYIMDNGYAWLVTDSLAVIKCRADLRGQPFLVVRLTLTEDGNRAYMTIDDGNDHILYTQYYEYTDAKRDVKLYWENGVLLLPSEH